VKKHIALIVPVFYPSNSSAAIQLSDLAREFVKQNYKITVFVPSESISIPYKLTINSGFRVVSLKTLKKDNVPYFRRAIAEFLMPYFMIWNLRNSKINKIKWDGLIWYSPSIFFGPFVRFLNKNNSGQSYLILRDIFPDWALDLGLINRGIAYHLFKYIEKNQYKIASRIGVQTESNINYFIKFQKRYSNSVEVLYNWLSDKPQNNCSINLSSTKLANRKIAIYAGNMGVAQNLHIFLNLAETLSETLNIGFLFIGRGSEMSILEKKAARLDNVLFLNEIKSSDINSLYRQCHIGLVSLDRRHKIDNIPGKFISYITAGLPVLALVNEGNDLINLVNKFDVGFATSKYSVEELKKGISHVLNNGKSKNYNKKCKQLAAKLFSTKIAVSKISKTLFN
jgi:glycosyltransferase involved in cell wall biosynthesis